MSNKVIINADDFGLSEAVNYGLIKSITGGIIDSVSMFVNQPATDHAVSLIKQYPHVFVGLHVNFVLGRPCADPATIPSLVDEDGNFFTSSWYRTGKKELDLDDAVTEMAAQIERFKSLFGYYPQHIEGHSIVNETFGEALRINALKYGIQANQMIHPDLPGFLPVRFELTHEMVVAGMRGITIDDFKQDIFGIFAHQDDDTITEIHMHPAYVDQYLLDHSSLNVARCQDLVTLCSDELKTWIKDNEIQLLNFGQLRLADQPGGK